MRTARTPSAVVFDLGGVLIDWDPRHLYRKLFPGDEAAMENFLRCVCTQAWNEQQDTGRSFADGVAELKARYPEHAGLIEAYDARWEEMLAGPIEESVALLGELRARGTPLYALTNWSAEKFPIARRRFDFIGWFDGIIVSGEVGLKKPDPEIFRLLVETHGLEAAATLFVDDNVENVGVTEALGFRTIRFCSPARLRTDLVELGLL